MLAKKIVALAAISLAMLVTGVYAGVQLSNTLTASWNIIGARDIAITGINLSKTVVGQGYSLNIKVTATDQGDLTETFNVTAYANSTVIQEQEVTLVNGTSTTLVFTWNTIGVPKAKYTITAVATPVMNETDTADNTLTDGTVTVVTPGDVNADGVVNIADYASLSAHWYPGPPIGPLGYDSTFDINGDGSINIADAAIVSAYWTGPPKGPLAP